MLKSVVDQDLVDACHAAMRGHSFIYCGVLTVREDEVVNPIAEGHSSGDR